MLMQPTRSSLTTDSPQRGGVQLLLAAVAKPAAKASSALDERRVKGFAAHMVGEEVKLPSRV
eukprot:scaffold215631_cov39-Tisochrysis_lutea.AAC.2